MKFTFKINKPTGSYSCFGHTNVDIKLNKKVCGSFFTKCFDSHIKSVGFMIEKDDKHDDDNPNCSWMWIFLKVNLEQIQEVKDWLNEHAEEIANKYKLHFQ